MRRVGSSPHARTMKSTCFGKCFFRYPSGQRTADPGAERPIPSRQSRPLFCRKAAQTFLCAQRARFFFPKRGASQPPILFSAAEPPRPFWAAPQMRRPTQGACVSGDRSLFNQKGPLLRHTQRGLEPCSPVNPFFLEGRFGLGDGASRRLCGVPGRISASGRQKSFRAPAIFLWYR